MEGSNYVSRGKGPYFLAYLTICQCISARGREANVCPTFPLTSFYKLARALSPSSSNIKYNLLGHLAITSVYTEKAAVSSLAHVRRGVEKAEAPTQTHNQNLCLEVHHSLFENRIYYCVCMCAQLGQHAVTCV